MLHTVGYLRFSFLPLSLYLQLHDRSCGYPAQITQRSTDGFTSHCALIGPKPSQLQSLFGQSNFCVLFVVMSTHKVNSKNIQVHAAESLSGKITVFSLSTNSPYFMKPEVSLLCSQEQDICPCLKSS